MAAGAVGNDAAVAVISVAAVGIVFFSLPEPKAHGELIVYQSSRRPSVRPYVRASVRPHF